MISKLQIDAQIESKYEMDGKLLFLPLQGKGPFHATISKYEMFINQCYNL